jgi:type II secretory pathway pseudopilin PulG
MIGLLCFVLAILGSPFKSKLRLEAENAVLRHQLNVLRRSQHGRVRLTNHDRWFLIQLYRWFPSILKVLTIIQPETLVRWAASLGRFLPAATPVPAPRRRTSQRRFPKDQYFAADEQKGTAR